MNPKPSSVHVFPILVTTIAVFMISVVAVVHVSQGTSASYASSVSVADKSLTTSLLTIKANKNGLATISLSNQLSKPSKTNSPIMNSGKALTNTTALNTVLQQVEANVEQH